MSTPLITASTLHKQFPPRTRKDPAVPVLRGISLSVLPGEMVAVVGPSGSGKSTLLYCLSGLESPTSGSLTLMGRDLGSLSRAQVAALRRDHVGFVFQQFNLVPSLSARENVALPARLARRPLDAGAIDAALASVGLGGVGPGSPARKLPGELSGGQQQRVAVARVLVQRPSVIFADEPTGSLDTANGTEVLRLLRSATARGSSVVLVTHNLEAAALADRVLVMRDGSIHEQLHSPTPDDVLHAVRRAGEPAGESDAESAAAPGGTVEQR